MPEGEQQELPLPPPPKGGTTVPPPPPWEDYLPLLPPPPMDACSRGSFLLTSGDLEEEEVGGDSLAVSSLSAAGVCYPTVSTSADSITTGSIYQLPVIQREEGLSPLSACHDSSLRPACRKLS
ncbi:UNVERIFIED_CONTAM: hypothetical protein FKN15_055715 [Acipenser sinensis]